MSQSKSQNRDGVESADRRFDACFRLFGIVMNNAPMDSIVDSIVECVASHPSRRALPGTASLLPSASATIERARHQVATQRPPPAHVCFVNANNLNLATTRSDVMQAFKNAEFVLPDGVGVKLALRRAGGRLWSNLNGTDLFAPLAEAMAERGYRLYLLGGEEAVVEKAARRISHEHPKLQLAGWHHGYFKPGDEDALCHAINASGADWVLVGMGTPRQELWFERCRSRLHVPLVLSAGGLIDFLGGKNPRAPTWVRRLGLEWVFRMMQEPGRLWRRYIIGNPVFLWRTRRWIRANPGQARLSVRPPGEPSDQAGGKP